MKSCWNCGKPLRFKGGNHKYCESCKDNLTKENRRLRDHVYYQKWKHLRAETLGTGWLGPKPNTNNFKEEAESINRELRRLGLNTHEI